MHRLLMVAGPAEIEKDILELGAVAPDYMRTPEFSDVLGRVYRNLQYAFQTKSPVFLFSSSGTGAMEAAVSNFLTSGDTVLAINGGSFGQRWCDICKAHNILCIEEKVEFGKSLEIEKIRMVLERNRNTKALLATLNETSSGAKTDIESLGKLLANFPDVLFIVDCVSGLLVEKMCMDEWGIDVAISCSQKALALPPGLAFLAASDKALSMAKTCTTRPFYFDVLDYHSNWKKNQTPFTPPITLVIQLDARLTKIRQEGLEAFRKRYEYNTQLIRDGIANFGFDVFAENPANCVTGIFTENFDTQKLIDIMRYEHNIEFASSSGTLAHRFFRIGNFGNINEHDIDYMLKALEETLTSMGVLL